MVLLAMVGVHALVFRPRMATPKLDTAVTGEAKLAASLSCSCGPG
jgi:hypothetical protein